MRIALCVFVLFVAAARGADAPPPDALSDDMKIFLWHAGGSAIATRLAVNGTTIPEAEKREFVELLDTYINKAHVATKQLGVEPMPYEKIAAQAGAMSAEFDEKVLGPWLTAHPQAHQAIERENVIAHIAFELVHGDSEKLVKAASAAGLPAHKEAEVRKLLSSLNAELTAYNDKAQQRQQPIMQMPEGPQKEKLSMLVMAEGQMWMVEKQFEILSKLRAMALPEAHEKLNEQILAMDD